MGRARSAIKAKKARVKLQNKAMRQKARIKDMYKEYYYNMTTSDVYDNSMQNLISSKETIHKAFVDHIKQLPLKYINRMLQIELSKTEIGYRPYKIPLAGGGIWNINSRPQESYFVFTQSEFISFLETTILERTLLK